MPTPNEPDSFAALFESASAQAGPRRVRVGDVLDLEVVRVGPSEVLVALDGKQEGFILSEELTDAKGESTVHVGSRVAARVVDIDRKAGGVRLSPLSSQPIVSALSDAPPGASSGATRGSAVIAGLRVKGKVTGVERYGLFVEFPIAGEPRPGRGLIPTAELGAPRGADLRKGYPVGTEIEAAVLAVDERGRIRLSVIALNQAEERSAFENFSAGAKDDAKREKPGFGTFGDLLKKKKK